MYRSLSVERSLGNERAEVYAAAVATTPTSDTVLAREEPWRQVTGIAHPAVDTHEICVAIVETGRGDRIVSVSAVVGPESAPGALDVLVREVGIELNDRADAIVANVD